MLIEFKNLLCKAVTAQHELVALGDLQVGHAAKAVADGAVEDVYKRQTTKFAQSELDPAKQKAGYHYHSDTLPLLVYRSE